MKKIIVIFMTLSLLSCSTYKPVPVMKGAVMGAVGGPIYTEMIKDGYLNSYDPGKYDAGGYYNKIAIMPTEKETTIMFVEIVQYSALASLFNRWINKEEVPSGLSGYFIFSTLWGGYRLGNLKRR